MNTAYLILGGNIGDRRLNLDSAAALIHEKVGSITKKSGIFETSAWGNTNQPDFYNQAICIETNLSASELLNQLLMIEKILGRERSEKKWEERTMDIDILFFNEEIIEETHLKIPHPYLHERKFVLEPLVEIAVDFQHPVLKKNIVELLKECKDPLIVKKLLVKS